MSLKNFARGALLAASFSLAGLSAAAADGQTFHPSMGGIHAGMTYGEAQSIIAKMKLKELVTQGPTQILMTIQDSSEKPVGLLMSFSGKAQNDFYGEEIALGEVGRLQGAIDPHDALAMVRYTRSFLTGHGPSGASIDAFISRRFGDTVALTCRRDDHIRFYDADGHPIGPGGLNCKMLESGWTELFKAVQSGVKLPALAVFSSVTEANSSTHKVKVIAVTLIDMSLVEKQAFPLYEKYQAELAAPTKSLDGL